MMASIESKDKEFQEIKMIPDIKREVDNFKERLNNSSRYTMILIMLIFLLATTILILLCLMFANAGASSTPETPATQAGKHDITHNLDIYWCILHNSNSQ